MVRSETCVQDSEPYAWLGADFVNYLKEAEEKRMAGEVPLTVSKRLQRRAKASETVRAVARGSVQCLEFKKLRPRLVLVPRWRPASAAASRRLQTSRSASKDRESSEE